MPALKLDGRRIQGSLRISRALEQARPDAAPLFPADKRRRAVEEAEAWGESWLQPVPRRLFRWAALHSAELRRWLAGDVLRLPAPGLAAAGYGAARTPVRGNGGCKRCAGSRRPRRAAGQARPRRRADRGGDDRRARAERRRLPDRHDGAGAVRVRGPARAGRGPAGRRARDAAATGLSRTDSPRSCPRERASRHAWRCCRCGRGDRSGRFNSRSTSGCSARATTTWSCSASWSRAARRGGRPGSRSMPRTGRPSAPPSRSRARACPADRSPGGGRRDGGEFRLLAAGAADRPLPSRAPRARAAGRATAARSPQATWRHLLFGVALGVARTASERESPYHLRPPPATTGRTQ